MPYLRRSKLQTECGQFLLSGYGRALPMKSAVDLDGMERAGRAARPRIAFSSCGRTRMVAGILLCVVAAVALGGCGFNDGPGVLIIDPGRYNNYHCNDLIARSKQLIKREQELRWLMDKASEGAGGTVIGTLAYRSDYESVRSEEKLLQRDAAEKKCDLVAPPSNFQSDQTIR
jgi:hypothetical protein